MEKFQFDPNFDEFDDYVNKAFSITPQISSTHDLFVNEHTTQWGVTIGFFPVERHVKNWNPENTFPHDPGGRTLVNSSNICKSYLQSKMDTII